jgi:hypothetical protein
MLRVRDRLPGGAAIELDLDLAASELTAAELIGGRVRATLAGRADACAQPLVETTAEERALNGGPGGPPDHARETARALEAFRRGRFVLLVDGRHLLREDERVTVGPDTDVTFLRLVPLRGG